MISDIKSIRKIMEMIGNIEVNEAIVGFLWQEDEEDDIDQPLKGGTYF
jgi:hypothetical protein